MKIIIHFFLLLTFIPGIFSQPQIKVSLTGGYNFPMADFKGDVSSYNDNFNTYTMKSGFGFGANAKYYFGSGRNYGATLYIGYQVFSTSADTLYIYNEIAPFIAKDFKRKINDVTIAVGLEYSFMPAKRITPFIGAEFAGHFFSGGFEYTYDRFNFSTDQKTETRYGIAGGIGIDAAISNNIGIVAGAKYQFANMIGKDSTGGTAKGFGLDDIEHKGVLGEKINARNISYLQTYIGVSYYFNQPKRVSRK